MVDNGVTTNFFYDSNGNQIRKEKGIEKWYYTYDFENRLTKVEYFDGTQTLTLGQYYYDGDGKRIKKVESSQTTIYIYLGWNIIYEKESSTMTETKHVFGPNGHVADIKGSTKYYYHSDHLGSLKQETDDSGNALWSSPAQYDPFGEMRSGGPEKDGYFYTGKLRDTSTGLYYYGARYYDAKIGRFITKDPFPGFKKEPQTQNLYTYVTNNPINAIDPTGNYRKEEGGSTARQGSEIIAADPTNGGRTGGSPYDDGHQSGYSTFTSPDFNEQYKAQITFKSDGTFSGLEAEQAATRLAESIAKQKGLAGTDFDDFVKGFLDGIQKGAGDWNKHNYDYDYAGRGSNIPGDWTRALDAMIKAALKEFCMEFCVGVFCFNPVLGVRCMVACEAAFADPQTLFGTVKFLVQ